MNKISSIFVEDFMNDKLELIKLFDRGDEGSLLSIAKKLTALAKTFKPRSVYRDEAGILHFDLG